MSQAEVGGYKVEPSAEADHPQHQGHHPHHPNHPQQHPSSHHQQHPPHPRPGIHQSQQPPSSFSSPHQPPQHQHQSPYAQASNIPGPQHPHHQQQQDPIYFHPAPYGTPGGNPPQYPSQGSDLMAHNMNRPYPPMYHTPQSNSPASVASPTGPDPRSVYNTPPMPQQMYGYPQSYAPIPAPPPNYAPHPQQHSITSQPMLMSQAPGQSISPPQHQQHLPQHQQHSITNPSPRPQQLAKTNINNHRASPATSGNTANGSSGSAGSGTVNPNAAPGPIPATTPLVVRQDNNGVQWIAFEYSRDRVKMEYTIRCDVESVNVDTLSLDFKTENCVYPRACCAKDQYRGNRLVYETECNTVGWALAELNPCLRGKRGLIQRAVDSWRNSNQDPKLRSRRVRRMAKLNSRKANAAAQHQTQVGAGSSVHNTVSNTNASVGLGLKGALLGDGSGQSLQTHHHAVPAAESSNGVHEDGSMGGMLHHHHNPGGNNYAPVGSMPSTGNSRSTSGHLSPAVGGEEFPGSNGHHHHHHQGPPTNGDDLRPRTVFHGYPNYPPQPVTGASMAPNMHEGIETMGSSNSQTNAVATSAPAANMDTSSDSKSLFGDIPDSKRRKFILVDDPHRGSRVRVRVMLDQVQMQEIPDSYRKSNSVYPRSYISEIDSMPSIDKESDTVHSSQITIPLLDGSSLPVSAPPPAPGKKRKERQLNELAYRMSWSQSRVFAGRHIFLQRALDAYRNKMRSSMMATGQDVTVSAPHLETRAGKRRWLERGRRSTSAAASSSK